MKYENVWPGLAVVARHRLFYYHGRVATNMINLSGPSVRRRETLCIQAGCFLSIKVFFFKKELK